MTGAQFEISIEGVPRTYRDRKDYASEAARNEGDEMNNNRALGLAQTILADLPDWLQPQRQYERHPPHHEW